ncbi:hypothetical protein PSCICF_36510 [Pseudomonas cichorii]|nr:hypothetical protein PSCICF_36510 [Pseudomonas cichorii]
MSEPATPSPLADERFDEVLALIYNARQQVMQAVNSRLIELYWQVAYISRKLEQAEWGDAVVSQLADHLARTQPGLRGFTLMLPPILILFTAEPGSSWQQPEVP